MGVSPSSLVPNANDLTHPPTPRAAPKSHLGLRLATGAMSTRPPAGTTRPASGMDEPDSLDEGWDDWGTGASGAAIRSVPAVSPLSDSRVPFCCIVLFLSASLSLPPVPCLRLQLARLATMPPIVRLYNTFGSGSTERNSRSRVQLTDIDERLEEWKDGDEDIKSEYGSDISKEDADITTALISEGGALGEPEVRRRFWSTSEVKGKKQDLDSIATQVRLPE